MLVRDQPLLDQDALQRAVILGADLAERLDLLGVRISFSNSSWIRSGLDSVSCVGLAM